jgi:hypothetical protein
MLKGHSLSAVHDCLFNIFTAILHTCKPYPQTTTQGCTMLYWQGTHFDWAIGFKFFNAFDSTMCHTEYKYNANWYNYMPHLLQHTIQLYPSASLLKICTLNTQYVVDYINIWIRNKHMLIWCQVFGKTTIYATYSWLYNVKWDEKIIMNPVCACLSQLTKWLTFHIWFTWHVCESVNCDNQQYHLGHLIQDPEIMYFHRSLKNILFC